MLGDVRPGPGWRARDDGRYQNPVSMEELRRINADYVRANRPFVWPLVRDTSATHVRVNFVNGNEVDPFVFSRLSLGQ